MNKHNESEKTVLKTSCILSPKILARNTYIFCVELYYGQ